MPKFGQCTFNEDYFGTGRLPKTFRKQSIHGIPLGLEVRRSIGKAVTFRVRRGNGNYGSIAGHRYQDKYGYFVPGSINNPESQPYRQQWIAAVHKWKYDSSTTQKKVYNTLAHRNLQMSGFNLFMRRAMKGEIDMYVDRGDPAAFDFTAVDFTDDGTWRELDISAIIPVSAKAILLQFDIETVNQAKHIRIRKYSNANVINHQDIETFNGGVHQSGSVIVAVDHNRIIEYNIDTATWTELDVVIRAWWT